MYVVVDVWSTARISALGALVAGGVLAPLATVHLPSFARPDPARPAAAEVVLLRNDGVLPLAPDASLVVITAGTTAPVPDLARPAEPIFPAEED